MNAWTFGSAGSSSAEMHQGFAMQIAPHLLDRHQILKIPTSWHLCGCPKSSAKSCELEWSAWAQTQQQDQSCKTSKTAQDEMTKAMKGKMQGMEGPYQEEVQVVQASVWCAARLSGLRRRVCPYAPSRAIQPQWNVDKYMSALSSSKGLKDYGP